MHASPFDREKTVGQSIAVALTLTLPNRNPSSSLEDDSRKGKEWREGERKL